ncbi:MAG: c-type cytochrome [Akkermansiaceae bacterium]|nr:c-type cytochrome [Akkermansiaceae bacterium]
MKHLPLLLLLGLAAAAIARTLVVPGPETRRLEVLFFGAPTANHPGHDPITRYRVLKKHLGDDGINLSYVEDPAQAFHAESLRHYDALLMYGNWAQRGPMPEEQELALVDFVDKGGGFLPVHCASACYGGSEKFVALVGGAFQSHGTGVFAPATVDRDHPVTKGYEGFEAWDETYVHERHGGDRTILQERDGEPWTWVRTQGKGRVFYTASGHDHRVWDLPQFHDLLRRAICWSVGGEARARLEALGLPDFEMMDVKLPGYREKKLVTRVPKPFSPEESMKLAQVPAGFELALFAAEPDIVNPIAINWDRRGRAFVVETIDYPNNLQAGDTGHDRIRICEDTNGDGRADKFTVFADKLSIPTTLCFANGGVICTNGPEVLFLKDTDGDNRADVREVLFEGIRTGDTHAGTSNFRYGFDNWIWATTGYSGFKGHVGGEEKEFSTGVYRFKPDGSALEFLQNTTNNTWGLGFSEEFDVHGSTANANPSWFLGFPRRFYRQAGLEQPRTPRADDNPDFFPSSTDIRQVDQFDKYTSGAGHAFYTSRRFPEHYWNRIAFICGPTGKLVGQFERIPKGAGFAMRQLPNNLYNSADAWSAPVAAEVGPDGAVWICDWYNIVVQHNPTPNKQSSGLDAVRGKGNAYVTPLRDKQHGRIYRIYPKGSGDDRYEASLSSPNLLWRLHAQQGIVEDREHSTAVDVASGSLADTLRNVVRGSQPQAALHAFQALQGLGSLDLETIKFGLNSRNTALRRAALRNAPRDDTLAKVFVRDGRIREADPRAMMDLLLALSRLAPSEAIGAALYRQVADDAALLEDPVLRDAWQVAARRHAADVLQVAAKDLPATAGAPEDGRNLLPNPGFSEIVDGRPAGWTDLRVYGGGDQEGITLASSPEGRDGSPCLMIKSTNVRDCGAAVVVAIKPRTRYRLTGWVRTRRLKPARGPGALLNIHSGARTEGLRGTTDWTRVSLTFDSGNRREAVIHCLFGGYGGATGTAWFDDVSLVEAGTMHDATGAVEAVAEHFGRTAAPAAKTALVAALRETGTDAATALAKTIAAQRSTARVITRSFTPDPKVHQRGAAVYERTCIACHGPDGRGVEGAFPPLDGSDWLTADAATPVKILLHGLTGPIEVEGATFNNVMPPHVDLADRDIADVLTFARQRWSNDAAAVRVTDVRKVREETKGRDTPWTAKELRP